MSGGCLLSGVAVQRCRIPVRNPSDSTGQGSGQSSARIDGTSHGELDFLVHLASHAPGLILGPHEVRLLIALCRAVPSQGRCVSEHSDTSGETAASLDEESVPVALQEAGPRPSPPRSPHTRWRAWPCRQRESRVLGEGRDPLLRHHQDPVRRRYVRTCRSLVARSEQGPTNQHRTGATTGLRPRFQPVAPPSCLQSGAPRRQHQRTHTPLSALGSAAERAARRSLWLFVGA
jgi:hypothetical protein